MSVSGYGTGSVKTFDETKFSSNPIDCLCDDTASQQSMTIRDHYHAYGSDCDKQINYQKGLSNYSNLVLGDDRVFFKKTMTSCFHDVECNPSDAKTLNRYKSESVRRRQYEEALAQCGGTEAVDNTEKMIKLKLEQRSKFGIFQLHKNFKFHDRSNSGYIELYDFTKSLELLGFQFNEHQNVALFARFDPECRGTLVYNDFIAYFSHPTFHSRGGSMRVSSSEKQRREETKGLSDDECAELQRKELKKIFDSVDKEGKGSLSPDELLRLLSVLRLDIRENKVQDILGDMGLKSDASVEFDRFFNWWIESPQLL
mmetsp:Transcript_26515/g.26765  ORF Transcript_26515/g.26765 Transcript_26515/m.26765 type:complete len:313 (+) Transcript_26515:195-1133(+)|eukprot:CAMPEP_0182426016 /NCGR_PEP_ID=MMETSP1167-20130531/12493_1 /TAXON_ID=2988 /ORGANISM="Mallomonas Sp, Strain CCMP3275" /LENGTH=312 /DNA_ID=CAMNT_0024607155 /DNA_START=168 /DNA_END=1106 /DNA_ORIENTATION=-